MVSTVHPTLAAVTERVRQRSAESRSRYLTRMRMLAERRPRRQQIGAANLAHTFAAAGDDDKVRLRQVSTCNVGIVTAYNDMLSAHQPYADYPRQIKAALAAHGAVAQVAGGVPAMCDGITQGRVGMELSLFSRDVIALSTAVALSHDVFDAVLCLGICDKIVPGLLMGALAFGYLPVVFVPGGPMPSGLSNPDKHKVRQAFVSGRATAEDLLEAEAASYHSPGTCTFYGTANTNQMLMEIMGLHLPGASFPVAGTPLRGALTKAAAERALVRARTPGSTLAEMLDERSFVNAVVALQATGGSTNLTLHLVAAAAVAGISLQWEDFDALSSVVPLLTRIYPNGTADINAFQAAGGTAMLIRELLAAKLLHEDVGTVWGTGLAGYTQAPTLVDGALKWQPGPIDSADTSVLASVAQPFQPHGGLRVVQGNLGRGVTKVSAVQPSHRQVHAPAAVFDDQHDVVAAFQAGHLARDVVVVLRFQGPRANGMPELHRLTPVLGELQDAGHRVALVTDGRLSGASGKVPAVIHVCPEASAGGPLAMVRDGDPIRIDLDAGELLVDVDASVWRERTPATVDAHRAAWDCGRELFAGFRQLVSPADRGASTFVGVESGGPLTSVDSPSHEH